MFTVHRKNVNIQTNRYQPVYSESLGNYTQLGQTLLHFFDNFHLKRHARGTVCAPNAAQP